jgi:hypothetical protein
MLKKNNMVAYAGIQLKQDHRSNYAKFIVQLSHAEETNTYLLSSNYFYLQVSKKRLK